MTTTTSRHINAAIKGLHTEETSLKAQLATVQKAIAAISGKGSARKVGRKKFHLSARRLSNKGRAAISQAAKKRWVKVRKGAHKGTHKGAKPQKAGK